MIKKRILWRYIGEKGSGHDSPAFNESKLGKKLEFMAEELMQQGIYIVGDSAYAIRSYLLTPFDNAAPGSSEDAFNFYLSNMRIYVECTFGEIDRRWGILWKPLDGKLETHKYTIDSCMRLHNFIVDWRENDKVSAEGSDIESGDAGEAQERAELDIASDQFMVQNMYGVMGGVLLDGEEEELKRRGRRTDKETRLRTAGTSLRFL